MNIIVCLKQVPDTSQIRTDPQTHQLIREGVPAITNPYDEYALELALSMRDKMGGTVILLSMGPNSAINILRNGIATGADEAFLICDSKLSGSDTLITGRTLARSVRKIEKFLHLSADLIFCGMQAIDGETAQVGPILAELLQIPQITGIRSIQPDSNTGGIVVSRVTSGMNEKIYAHMPALLTVSSTGSSLRMPTLKGQMFARKKKIQIWNCEDLSLTAKDCGLQASPTKVISAEPITSERVCRYFSSKTLLNDSEFIDLIHSCRKARSEHAVIQDQGYDAPTDNIEESKSISFSKDIPAQNLYESIFAIIETDSGNVVSDLDGLLSLGRDLSDTSGHPLVAIILGDKVKFSILQSCSKYADILILCEHSLLAKYETGLYTKVLSNLFCKYRPDTVLINATVNGKALAPRLSCRFSTGLTADCTNARIAQNGKDVVWIRPTLGGNLEASIICPNCRPQMGTIRPGAIQKKAYPVNHSCIVLKTVVSLDPSMQYCKTLDQHKYKDTNFSSSEIIVSAGMGIEKSENLALIREFAEQLGASVGASREVINHGWLPPSCQIGQSGQIVRPCLYIACGISGAVQHLAGMLGSQKILAINSDPEAPIFRVSDYGIIGDLKEVLPDLSKSISQLELDRPN